MCRAIVCLIVIAAAISGCSSSTSSSNSGSTGISGSTGTSGSTGGAASTGSTGNTGNTGSTGDANGKSVAVSKATWHDGPWPFTVDHGILGCTQPPFPGAVTFNVDGTVYAINGTARDAAQTDPGTYPFNEVNPIWKKAPGGLRVDIGGMIDKGLALCPQQ